MKQGFLMKVNADFSQRVVVRPNDEQWTQSPQESVDRLYLDRIGGEVARATSFVRFAPGSYFPVHIHGGGEEIFVLDGAFEDQNGVYAAGAYLRDPIGSSHAPSSRRGCTLFVKLWQFDPDDHDRVGIDTASGEWRKTPEGFAIQPLHHFAGVTTFLVRLDPGAILSRTIHPLGEEMIVLAGVCSDADGNYPAGTWIRDPGGHKQDLFSAEGCMLFVKTGHVASAAAEVARMDAAAGDASP
jgi:anti-sigma factor ChrR (cupin superfamily)